MSSIIAMIGLAGFAATIFYGFKLIKAIKTKQPKKQISKRLGISILVCFATVGLTPTESDTTEFEQKIAQLQEENQSLNDEVSKLEEENETLNAKIEEAQPFFDMKEEERLALEAEAKKAEEEREAKELAEAEAKKAEELEAKTVTLSNGNYISGNDFEAGVYDVVAISGNGNVSSSNMFSGGLNAVMGVKGGDLYQKEYKNIKLPEGTELSIDGVTVKLVPKE